MKSDDWGDVITIICNLATFIVLVVTLLVQLL